MDTVVLCYHMDTKVSTISMETASIHYPTYVLICLGHVKPPVLPCSAALTTYTPTFIVNLLYNFPLPFCLSIKLIVFWLLGNDEQVILLPHSSEVCLNLRHCLVDFYMI